MTINIKDLLLLDDDNEYVVVSKVNYENKNYYYLIDKNNLTSVKFCYEDTDKLIELDDKVLTTKLLPLFLEASKDEFETIKQELENLQENN
ncbi:MAG: hypothetical protein IJZ79_05810 [Bacilli bacterium]|nr:hypothetical protein [Bacilli bacterium]